MIPLTKMHHAANELKYVSDAIARGQVSGDGYYTERVEKWLEKQLLQGERVFMTTSATHALEMAMLLIGLVPGDEVIMPSFTFSSTANAVILRGARPVFAEIDEATLNIDPADIERKITSRTKAIITVHYAGIGCDMDVIMALAAKHGLYVVEDAAQAVGSRYKGRALGSIGQLGCYSFHGTKNVTCGEGGAIIIDPDNTALIDRADCIRQKGTDRSRFLRGEAGSYSWVDAGSSYSPSEVLMAMLLAQLEELKTITEKRRQVHLHYDGILNRFAGGKLVKTVTIPPACESNYHIYYLLFRSPEVRNMVMHELNRRGIAASFHYMPLHSAPMGVRLGFHAEDLPVTEGVSKCILRLPIYPGLTQEELAYIGKQLVEIMEAI